MHGLLGLGVNNCLNLSPVIEGIKTQIGLQQGELNLFEP